MVGRDRAYTFDDVLLVPCRSSLQSRFHTDVETQFTKRFRLKLPVVAANMDTVSEKEMCIAMNSMGATAILHRFMTIEDQVVQVKAIVAAHKSGEGTIAASIGVNQDSKERAKALVDVGAQILTVDIAHGHSDSMIDMVKYLKKEFPKVDVIAGNIATPRAAEDLIAAGADAVKVGIGPGSMCTTRIITGVGMPQLSAIATCSAVGQREGVPMIADGGIKTSGDAMKALAAGASSVMLGNVLAGCLETPGELVNGRKAYRGMASRSAQTSWRGGQLPEGMAPEGESTFVNCKGPAREIVQELVGGIRSGMSYLNSRQLSDLSEFAYFVEVSPNCLRENHAHGLMR
ncbi:MAG: IMP dehydrogenase [Deltaproteobacteria bacterium]|nr:IMP dehydrogenase [Deltaproteobacteria bacterium]